MTMSKKISWTGERLETTIFDETTIEHLHRYAFATELIKEKKVLDIACGDGYGSNLMAKEANEVYGIDIDSKTINEAKVKYQKKNLSFVEGSIENIQLPAATFEAVVCFETIEHIDNHDKAISEIKKILKPDGVLIISTPEKGNYTDKPGNRNPFHKKELTESEFVDLLKKYFEFISVSHQNFLSTSIITQQPTGNFKYYEGNFNEIVPSEKIEALYLIAVCSDKKIKSLPSSLFITKSIFEKALSAREDQVRSTISYKIGHALLLPFKLIRYLLNKSPVK